MLQIIGLDISKASVSACLISEKITDAREFYYRYAFQKFDATVRGMNQLFALIGSENLGETIAIMEPTGVNYSRLWGTQLARAGVEVRLVGHRELRSFREHNLGLPDKDDDADALALAIYGWDYQDTPRRFVQVRDHTIVEIRRLVLRLAHLNRVQSPIINRARQDLAWQLPEAALIRSLRYGDKVPLLWGWLCGERQSVKYDLMVERSIGLGITDELRKHAARICDLQREEMILEFELSKLVGEPQFLPYRKIFARFGFGRRVEALLLSQIYPLENYLAADGRPDVKIRTGRKSGKPTKRHLSLHRFCKALGYAPTQESSGDLHKSKVSGGSDLCRRALWQWIFTRIEPTRSRLHNDIGDQLGKIMDEEKLSGRPVRLIRSRVAAKAVKMLFKELVRELVYAENLNPESKTEYQELLE